VPGGMNGFKTHLNGHSPPFRCGYCAYAYQNRRTLYQHLRDHHQPSSNAVEIVPSVSDDQALQEPDFDFGGLIELRGVSF